MTASAWSGPRQHAFSTADPLLAREFLDQAYGGRLRVAGTGNGTRMLTVTVTDAGWFAVSDATLPADLGFTMTGHDEVIISIMLAGTMQADRAKDTGRYQRGDVLIGNFPQASYTCRTHDLRDRNITLPAALFGAVADPGPGRSVQPRFLSPHPVSAAARSQWLAVAGYIDGLLGNPDAAVSPLVIASAGRLLAATALAVFPSTATAGPAAGDRRDAGTATVRRAACFIDEHATRDISVADIAAAAHVTIRAVQLAFRRHLDTTPLGYLRRVRLERAHAELLAADSSRESVTAVAYRWGFSSPSRFTAAYRQAYGQAPSQTLRQNWADGRRRRPGTVHERPGPAH